MSDLKDKIAWWMRESSELTHDDCVPLVDAAFFAIKDAGYAIVPVEPTDEMIDAGLSEDGGGHDDPCNRSIQVSVWSAMIEAGKVKP